jgi:hypothetical protein
VKILGGEGANGFTRVLRLQRGLTYGASADVDAMKMPATTSPRRTPGPRPRANALRLMVEEFSKLQRQRVFERELADAQAYLAGSFPLTIETPNEIATQVLNAVFYDLPMQDIATSASACWRSRRTMCSVSRGSTSSRTGCRSCWSVMRRAFAPQLQSVGFTDYEVIPDRAARPDVGDVETRAAAAVAVGGAFRLDQRRVFANAGQSARGRTARALRLRAIVRRSMCCGAWSMRKAGWLRCRPCAA